MTANPAAVLAILVKAHQSKANAEAEASAWKSIRHDLDLAWREVRDSPPDREAVSDDNSGPGDERSCA